MDNHYHNMYKNKVIDIIFLHFIVIYIYYLLITLLNIRALKKSNRQNTDNIIFYK